jgi:hypothetical protein
MKKNNYLLLLLTVVMLFAASCGKDGAVGPQGPQGPTGPTGPQGPAGANGTVIYSGGTVPSSTQGVPGDFYIDLSTGMFYGPKLSTGWGTGISLIGPAGPAGTNGTNGTVIYSGTTTPPAATGNIGDFYIDLTTAVFYGPKATAGWGTGFPLVTGALGANFAPIINTIITPAILDTLQTHGTVINAGLTPPTVNGTYLISPDYCLYDNSGGNFAGQVFSNYEYEFSNQNSTSYAINVNYSNKISGSSTLDAGSDVSATYLSGSSSLFTVYAQTTGTSNGISYTSLQVISGEIVSGAIDNFQETFYLESKTGDTNNTILAPVGTLRIFKDEDGVSPSQSVFTSFKGIRGLGLLSKSFKQQ